MQAYSLSVVEQEVALARAIAETALSVHYGDGSGLVTTAPSTVAVAAMSSSHRSGSAFDVEGGTNDPYVCNGPPPLAETGGSPLPSVSLSDPVFRPRQGSHSTVVRLCKAAPGLHAVRHITGGDGGEGATVAGEGLTRDTAGTGSAAAARTSSAEGIANYHARHSSSSKSSPDAALPTANTSVEEPLVVLVATLEVLFPADYPTEPCVWRVLAGGTNTQTTLVPGSLGRRARTLSTDHLAFFIRHATQPQLLEKHQQQQQQEQSLPPLPHQRHTVDTLASLASADTATGLRVGTPSAVATPTFDAAPPPLGRLPVYATLPPHAAERLLGWVLRARGQQQHWLPPHPPPSQQPAAAGVLSSNASHKRSSVADSAHGAMQCRGRPTPSVPPFLGDFVALIKGWAALELELGSISLPIGSAVASSASAAFATRRVTLGTRTVSRDGIAASAGSTGTGLASSGSGGGRGAVAPAQTEGPGGDGGSVWTLVRGGWGARQPPPWAGYAQAVAAAAATRGRAVSVAGTRHAATDPRKPNRAVGGSNFAQAVGTGSSAGGGAAIAGVSGSSSGTGVGVGVSGGSGGGGVSGGAAVAPGGAAAVGGSGRGGSSSVLVPRPGVTGPLTASTVAATASATGTAAASIPTVAATVGVGVGDGPPQRRWVSHTDPTSAFTGLVGATAAGAESPPGGNPDGPQRRPQQSRRATFAVCFLPQGGVLAWGRAYQQLHQQTGSRGGEVRASATSGPSTGTTTAEAPARSRAAMARAALPPHVAAFLTAASAPSGRGTALLFTSRFAPQRPLPSLVTPACVLRCPVGKHCRWADVRLHINTEGTASAALQANAKLCKALELPAVSNLFATLQRLAKGLGSTSGSEGGGGGGGGHGHHGHFSGGDDSGGSTAPTYATAVLAPVLERAVENLQEARQPFWAGVAVCCLVLPGVLTAADHGSAARFSDSTGKDTVTASAPPPMVARSAGGSASSTAGFTIALFLRDKANAIAVVAHVERLFGLVGAYVQCCEARLARLELEAAVSSTLAGLSATRTRVAAAPAAAGIVGRIFMPPSAVRHDPVKVCAVCGLGLQRHVRSSNANGAAGGGGGSGVVQLVRQVSQEASSILFSLTGSPTGVTAPPTFANINTSGVAGEDSDASTSGGTTTAAAAALRRGQSLSMSGDVLMESSPVLEGCLVVQCLRCGHGGHIEHIAGWWTHATVRCCPKGCDCVCIY